VSSRHHESHEGFIVHASFSRSGGAPVIYLIGRLKNAETFAVVEERERPCFYVRESEIGRISNYIASNRGARVDCAFRTIDGEPCEKLCWDTVLSAQRAAEDLPETGTRIYEGDIRFTDQFLMSRYIHGSVIIKGASRKGRRVDRIFINPDLVYSDWQPSLSVLSLDIETDPKAGQIFAIGLAHRDPWTGLERDEVLFSGRIDEPCCDNGDIIMFPDERSMLEGFCDRILHWNPDIITGWNVIDFDFEVIARRIKHHGLTFQIGRSDEPAAFLPGEKGRFHTLIIPGRQALDAVRLVRAAPERFSDYKLETVARKLLGRGKTLDFDEYESKPDLIARMYSRDPAKLCSYCMEDARLVIDILEKTGLVDLTLRRCLLIGISLDRAWTSIHSFDYLYIESLHRRGLVAPSPGVDTLPGSGRAPGGAILGPRAGLYENVWVFDFISLYPSIIRTFNIDPVSFVPPLEIEKLEKEEHDLLIRAPNGACFSRRSAILPEILERFFENRQEAKKRRDEVASYVYKIIMNSFYGVLGARGSRFSSSLIAGAITSFGHHMLHWCEDYFTRKGYDVLYGDTDSLFVLSGLPGDAREEEHAGLSGEICARINKDLNSYIAGSFNVKSFLELEFEKVYYKFFLPPVRNVSVSDESGVRGRAKGYAGLLVPSGELEGFELPEGHQGRIEVVGMEAVRRDWTELARGFQIGLLELVFRGAGNDLIRKYISKVVTDLYGSKLDERLVYVKALRKPIKEYTRSKPPHVRAAEMLAPEDQRGLIRYVWTTDGPQPAGRITRPIDYRHYVEKQLKPIAGSFAEVLQADLGRLFGGEGQLELF
jgi:DNA polymerase-2